MSCPLSLVQTHLIRKISQRKARKRVEHSHNLVHRRLSVLFFVLSFWQCQSILCIFIVSMWSGAGTIDSRVGTERVSERDPIIKNTNDTQPHSTTESILLSLLYFVRHFNFVRFGSGFQRDFTFIYWFETSNNMVCIGTTTTTPFATI